jgi:hypothetical protein
MALLLVRDRRGLEARLIDEDWKALVVVRTRRGLKIATVDQVPPKPVLQCFSMNLSDEDESA